MKQNTKDNRVVLDSVLPLEMSLVGQGLVYSIVCESKKLVVVGNTTNLYQAIGRLIGTLETGSSEYGTLKEDLDHCSVSILETCGKGEVKLRTVYWIRHYEDKGYKLYKDLNPVTYTLTIDMDYHQGKLCFFVFLENRRGDRLALGMFKKKREMTEWIRRSYPDTSRVGRIVYHSSLNECERSYNSIKRSKP